MVLNFPFPHGNPLGQTASSILNIPIKTSNGLHYVGITALLLLIVSLFFLVKALKKYKARVTLIAIAVAIFAPLLLVDLFQKTFATGIYAISYEREESVCNFEMVNGKTLHGLCELTLQNNSEDQVGFSIDFYEEYLFEDNLPMVYLMNNSAPYVVSLNGKEKKRLKLETTIAVSNMSILIQSGESRFVNIIIRSGDKTRRL